MSSIIEHGQARKGGPTQVCTTEGDRVTQSGSTYGTGVPNHALSRTSYIIWGPVQNKNAGLLVQILLRIKRW